MRLIGSLNGTGDLIINGEDRGQTGYVIEVYVTASGVLQGKGTIEAPQADLFDAYMSNDVQIALKDGTSVLIVVANFEKVAPFKIVGPVPTIWVGVLVPASSLRH